MAQAIPDKRALSVQEILVDQVMSRNVPVIQASATLAQALRQMAAESLPCLLVTERDGQLVGILTERDMLAFAERNLNDELAWDEAVRAHMRTRLVCLRPEQALFEALMLARREEVRHLPVLGSEDRLAGLVTADELVSAHFAVFESERKAAHDAVAESRLDVASETMRLRLLSLEDPLLQIGNRRALELALEHTEQNSRRYQHVYSVAMFDVDRFKAYNDNYGHPAGDHVLVQIIRSFVTSMRSADRLFRYGGEEILLLMPETGLDGAMLVADRLRAGLEAAAIPHQYTRRRVVTVSGGVAEGGFRHETEGWKAVIERADRALYSAKKGGRNGVKSEAGPTHA